MTTSNLGKKLKGMYNSPDENKVNMILLFGVLYASDIKKIAAGSNINSVVNEIINYSGLPKSYATEIKKAILLSNYVSPTLEAQKKFL